MVLTRSWASYRGRQRGGPRKLLSYWVWTRLEDLERDYYQRGGGHRADAFLRLTRLGH